MEQYKSRALESTWKMCAFKSAFLSNYCLKQSKKIKVIYQAREWEASGHEEGPTGRGAECRGSADKKLMEWRGEEGRDDTWGHLRKGLRLHAEECFYRGGFSHESRKICNNVPPERLSKRGNGIWRRFVSEGSSATSPGMR